MPVRVVAVLGLVLTLGALAFALTESAPRQAGTNLIPEHAEVARVEGGQRLCQEGETVPADSGRLRLLVGSFDAVRPPLAVTVRNPDGPVTQGRLAAGSQGPVLVGVERVQRLTGSATVCIRNAGAVPIVLYGAQTPTPATVGGQPAAGSVRLEWMRPDDESWFDLAGTVAHRFGLAKANPVGGWLLWVTALVVLACWGLAGRLLLRELRA